MATDYTVDELICACISHQVEDGELVAQGLATPLVLAGYMLAKRTHAPGLFFASAVGNTVCADWSPLSLTAMESFWLGRAVRFLTFMEIICELLPVSQPKEFFRPAQVDAYGHTNNVVFGDYRRPRLRLPGAGGIPDVTTYSQRVYLYVPRHGRATFVPKLDFRSGVGVIADDKERQRLGVTSPGPRYLVSDLGTCDFAGPGGRMRLLTYHRGVSVEHIQARTGFPLAIAPDVHETSPPTVEEVRLLRQEIDPLGIRQLETLGGMARWQKLQEIVSQEIKESGNQASP